DGWGNRITYYLDTTASAVQTAHGTTTPCPLLGAESPPYSGVSICRATSAYPVGAIDVQLADATPLVSPTDRPIYILVSHGVDGNGAFATITGTQQASG